MDQMNELLDLLKMHVVLNYFGVHLCDPHYQKIKNSALYHRFLPARNSRRVLPEKTIESRLEIITTIR